jgi:hypothetical protein
MPKPQLAGLFESQAFGRGRAVRVPRSVLNYHQDRLVGKEGAVHQAIGDLIRSAGVVPQFAVADAAGKPVVGVETHTFRNGGVWIVALMTNPQLRVDELGPPEFRSNDRFAKPMAVRLGLPGERCVYDVRAAKALGRLQQVAVTLDPYEPTIFAIAPAEMPELETSAPARLKRGETASVGIRFAAETPAEQHVLHVDVRNPGGQTVSYYSGNLLAPGGRAGKLIPLAANDPEGPWEIAVKDLLTGQSKTSLIEVY